MSEPHPTVALRELPVTTTEDSTASWKIEVDWKAEGDDENEDAPLLSGPGSGFLQLSGNPFKCVWESGTALLTVGAFLISVSTLCVKLLHGRVPLFELIAIRSFGSVALICCLCRSSGINPIGPRKLWHLLLARGMSGAFSMTLMFGCIFLIPLTDATILFLTHPAWTAAVCWLFRIEPIKWTMGIGVFLCIGGVVLVTHPPIFFGGHQQWGLTRLAGIALGLSSAMFVTMSMLVVLKIGDRAPAICMTMWFQVVAISFSLPLMFAGFPAPFKWGLSWMDAGLLLCLVFSSSTSQTVINRGLQISSATKSSAILTSQIVFASMWGVLLLDEHLSMGALIGAVLIVAGVVVVSKGKASIESSREAATEQVHRWSWDRLAAWSAGRQQQAADVELTPAERLARAFG